MNPVLTNVLQHMDDNMPDDIKDDVVNVVKAGRQILYDPKTHQQLEIVKNPEARKDPVNTISNGIAGLGYILWMKSKKQMPADALIPAMVVLMIDIMDFSEKSFGLQISNEMVSATTEELMAKIYSKLGVKPEHLQQAIDEGQSASTGLGDQEDQQEQASTSPQPASDTMLPMASGGY